MAFGNNALCGPSNAFKSLSDNFEQDRSLTQDRLRQMQAGGSSTFKSISEPTHNGDYRAFMNNGASGVPPLPMGHQTLPLLPGQPIHHQLGGAVGPSQAARAPAPVADAGNWWAGEFNAMNNGMTNGMNNGMINPAVRSPVAPPVNQAPVRHVLARSPPVALAATRPYVPGPIGAPFGLGHSYPIGIEHDPFVDQHTAYIPAYLNPRAPVNYAVMTEEQLQASFDKFEALEEDFQDEMHAWMMRHGPNAQAEQRLEERRIDYNMERLADELDQAHLRGDAGLFRENTTAVETQTTEEKSLEESDAQDTELSRIAAQIIDSTAATAATNDKFKNSTFLNMMRLMQDSDVVLRGDKLVNKETGMPATSVSEPPTGMALSAAAEGSSAQGSLSPDVRGWWAGASPTNKSKENAADEQHSPSSQH